MDENTSLKCNHRIASEKTTIDLLPGRRSFTYPEHVYGVCRCCGKPFHYIRGDHGKLLSTKSKEYKEV